MSVIDYSSITFINRLIDLTSIFIDCWFHRLITPGILFCTGCHKSWDAIFIGKVQARSWPFVSHDAQVEKNV